MSKQPITNAAVGDKLRTARLKAGITQDELGTRVGVSGQSIALYEKGKAAVVPEMMGKIAGALKCNARDLLP